MKTVEVIDARSEGDDAKRIRIFDKFVAKVDNKTGEVLRVCGIQPGLPDQALHYLFMDRDGEIVMLKEICAVLLKPPESIELILEYLNQTEAAWKALLFDTIDYKWIPADRVIIAKMCEHRLNPDVRAKELG